MTDKMENPSEGVQGERIAKFLARVGIASRREVERMIEEGRVTLNGAVVTTPATLVSSPAGLAVDGQPVRNAAPTQVWKLHKPAGIVTTSSDPEGRPTVFDILPKRLPRVITVGRLDLTTEGLLLLTNDGALARWLELPENRVARRYRVRVYGLLREAALDELRRGVTIEGVQYGPVEITVDSSNTANAWLTVTLHEGKNREIRKLMQHAGLTVNRLIRTHYGPFALNKLERGMIEPVPAFTLHQSLSGFFGTDAEMAGDGEGGEGGEPRQPKTQNRAAWARNKPKANKPNQQKKRIAEKYGEQPEEKAKQPVRTKAQPAKNRPLRPPTKKAAPKSDASEYDRKPVRDTRSDGKPFNRRPAPNRPQGDRPQGDRPQEGERRQSARPQSTRPQSTRAQRERHQTDRPHDARGDSKPFGKRPSGERPQGNRPQGDRPQGGKPQGGRPQGERPGRPSGPRPSGSRPSDNRPSDNRPAGGRPNRGAPRGKR